MVSCDNGAVLSAATGRHGVAEVRLMEFSGGSVAR